MNTEFTTKDWVVRGFTPEDYGGVVDVHNLVFPDYPETVNEWRYQDSHRDPKLHFERRISTVARGTDHCRRYDEPHVIRLPSPQTVDGLVRASGASW